MTTRKPGLELDGLTNLCDRDLHSAPLAAVLLHGLASGDSDPALGVLYQLRDDLAALGALLTSARDGFKGDLIDVSELGATMTICARRVSVAVELLERQARGAL